MVLSCAPFITRAQDTLQLPPGYAPYYYWDTLPDSVATAYKLAYPGRWKTDSIYFVHENRHFLDSLLADSVLKERLGFISFDKKPIVPVTLTDMPRQALPRIPQIPVWVAGIALLGIMMLIFLKFSNLRLFNLMFLSAFKPKYCNEALREYESPVNIYNLVSTFICALSYALFIWFATVKTGGLQLHKSLLVSFLLIFMAISLFYLLRYLIIMLGAAILEAEYVYGVLVQITVSANMWMALLIIPVLAMINAAFFHFTFAAQPLYLAAFVLAYLLAKQVRVYIQVANSFPHPIIYLILYLCALEVVPYLAIFKVVIQQIG